MYLCVYVCELSSGTFARTFEDLQYNGTQHDESGVIVAICCFQEGIKRKWYERLIGTELAYD